jgi:hypothetical protein
MKMTPMEDDLEISKVEYLRTGLIMPMEDKLKIFNVKYFCNHWSDLTQTNISSENDFLRMMTSKYQK